MKVSNIPFHSIYVVLLYTFQDIVTELSKFKGSRHHDHVPSGVRYHPQITMIAKIDLLFVEKSNYLLHTSLLNVGFKYEIAQVTSRLLQLTNYCTGWPKKFGTIILCALALPNISRFSKLFHYQNQKKICNNTVTKAPTTPEVCRYTTL